MCLLAEVTIGNLEGSPLQGAGAEMFRFVFPVMAACVLAIALMFQTCCPKTLIAARRDRNRATAAQQQLTNLVADDGVSLLRVSCMETRHCDIVHSRLFLFTASIERTVAWGR